MADKKPGLLKRIFSFGFGKKNQPEPEPEIVEDAQALKVEQEAAEAEAIAQAAAEEEATRLAAQETREAEMAAEAESVAQELKAAEKAKAKSEAARKKLEDQEHQAARLAAEQAKLQEAAEEQAQKEAAAAATVAAQKEAAEAESNRLKIEAEQREEAMRAKLAVEKLAAETAALEAEKLEAEKQVAEEKAAEVEAKLVAKAEADKRAAEEAKAAAAKTAEELAANARQTDADTEKADEPEQEPEPAQKPKSKSKKSGKSEIDEMDFDPEGFVPAPTEELKIEESVTTLTTRKAKKVEEPEPEPVVEDERKTGWLARLTKGLSRSSNQLKENITQVFTDKKLDDDTLQDLEDVLIQADLGVETAMKITEALSAKKFGKTVTEEEVREIMAEEIEKILKPVAQDLDLDLNHQPHVILVVGVNGSGKTTTIGKLASKLYDAGFSTTLVAGDTFRAAAIEQLKIWGDRTQSPVLSRPLGADSAGLAFDAWAEAKEQRRDVMLMDTAGRLQNRTELMAELEKIVRVLKKQDPTAPHTVLLTLDATTGQNALNQVEIFKQVAGVNGLVMTKLDGTARGGILVSISAKHGLPVYFVGVGEQVEDLEPFEAREFARSIAGLPREE
ncbi:MAG: signal recognition particle-docking protein FtsY [Salaquimonas sp.]